MLVCDHCFRKCCHMYCLDPPMIGDDVPDEPWYCDYCRRDHGVRSSLQSANIFAAVDHRRRQGATRLRRGRTQAHRNERLRRSRSDSQFSESPRRLNEVSRHSTMYLTDNNNPARPPAQPRQGRRAQVAQVLSNLGRWPANSRRSSNDSHGVLDPSSEVLVQDHAFAYNEELLSNRRNRRHRPPRRATGDRVAAEENSVARRPPSPLPPIHQARAFGRRASPVRGFLQSSDDFMEEFGAEQSRTGQGRLAVQLRSPPSEERLF